MPSPLARGLLVWALYAIPLVVAVRPVAEPVLDPDVWWHLRVGQWIVANGQVPDNDPFSSHGQDRPWVAYSWLYEVFLWQLYQAFGLLGIVVYRAGMALAVVAAVHALVCRVAKHFVVATALTLVAVLALAMLFSERPWLFTVLFTTLTLHAVVAWRQGESPWWGWALPVVFVLWANLHVQFVYGLVVLGIACLAPWIDRGLGWGEGPPRRSPLLLMTGLCLLATLVNPYHVRLHAVIVEYATQPGPFLWVNELKALEFREPCDWVMLALTGAAVYCLGRRTTSSFEILLLCTSAALAFRARRDLWFVVLADLVILAARTRDVPDESPSLSRSARALVVVGLLLVAGFKAWIDDLSPQGMQSRVARRFPVAAADAVARAGCSGPLYNDFNWGGYLIWALPHLPVAIDGRTNLHGDARIERYGRVWSGCAGWDQDPELRGAGVIVASVDSALCSLLRMDQRFAILHEDDVACVFVPRCR